MMITLNGESRDVTPDTTLTRLLDSLQIKPKMVAVQINERIVSKHELDSMVLNDGDVVELIRIVGGG